MNEQNEYNLVDEEWIPVLMKNGRQRMVSLAEIFVDPKEEIADVALNPYERIAMVRLLCCIAQAALGAERLKDETAWLRTRCDIGEAAAEYLRKWRHKFFLYGPSAFLQPDGITQPDKTKMASVGKLFFDVPSGQNATFRDHTDYATHEFPDPSLAMALLAFLSFAAGGGSSTCLWDNEPTAKTARQGPCRGILFTLLTGDSLIETIWLNLLTAEHFAMAKIAMGRPVWELDISKRSTAESLAKGYLGRLVPLSRVMKLTKGETSIPLGEGIRYPQMPDFREPMSPVRAIKKIVTHFKVDLQKHPWHDLASMLTVRSELGKVGRAMTIDHMDTVSMKKVTVWTGGLCANQAKDEDMVEWAVGGLMQNELSNGQKVDSYQKAVSSSDDKCEALKDAIRLYAKIAISRNAKTTGVIKSMVRTAEMEFWDALSLPDAQKKVMAVWYENINEEQYLSQWEEHLIDVIKKLFEKTCPCDTIARMKAFIFGRKLLFCGKKPDKAERETVKATKKAKNSSCTPLLPGMDL